MSCDGGRERVCLCVFVCVWTMHVLGSSVRRVCARKTFEEEIPV